MRRSVNAFAASVLLGLTAFASAGPVSAEVVLCESTARGSIKARQGSCLSGETEKTMAEDADVIGAEKRASAMPLNPAKLSPAIECDAYEDRYWVKDVPVN